MNLDADMVHFVDIFVFVYEGDEVDVTYLFFLLKAGAFVEYSME